MNADFEQEESVSSRRGGIRRDRTEGTKEEDRGKFGVRWQDIAFLVRDMSRSSKARTCPRTPKNALSRGSDSPKVKCHNSRTGPGHLRAA
jgi:hypothetical protein